MEELVHDLTQMEPLWKSSLLGTVGALYLFLWLILFVSFLNIYSVDKYEFLNNKQRCIEFKHKMFFIFMYCKEKHFISIKTFILELIAYIMLIVSIICFICSLFQKVLVAVILLGIISVLILAFGGLTGIMYGRIKHK